MLTKKQPSPQTNPANQKGLGIFSLDTIGLYTGITLKEFIKFYDKPKFIQALIDAIFINPSKVKCFL